MNADRREIRLEVEVPATPEQAWEAVATGAGMTAWYVPAEVAEREGGEITLDFGGGMKETCRVVVWDPPRRLLYDIPDPRGRGLAFEFFVETRDGGACVVRLVGSGFGTGADWDAEFDGMESGWKLFLANLALYLEHFPGQPAASIIVNGAAAGPRPPAWESYLTAAGLPTAPALGDRVQTNGTGTPALSGVVARVADETLTVRTDAPAPGHVFFAAEGGGIQTWTSFYAYFFGDDADAVAAREAPRWRAWMAEHFPPPAPPEAG